MMATKPDTETGHAELVVENEAAGEFLVSRRVFTETSILETERREIFEQCWLYVCHESELSKPNDFLTRSVAGREILVSRDKDNIVRAFFNTCPHRGAMVERELSGNKRGFRCFYHGWAFYNT